MSQISAEAFLEIERELRLKPLELNRYRKNSGDGRSQAFGLVCRRGQPTDYSRQCWRRPYLYKLLLEFGDKYVIPTLGSYTSITVNQNYQCLPHKDKGKVGNSFLVAFGVYTGGELVIHDTEFQGQYTIKHIPMIHNFTEMTHSVKPFQGNRFSLVYYTIKTETPLPAPSVVEVDGHWKFKRGTTIIWDGLPHPLKGRKKPNAAIEEGEFEIRFD